MKKFLFSILSCLILLISDAQVPNQVNYQGIARNSVGNVLPNQAITVRLSVRDGSVTGTVVYTETRNITTNAFGLFYYGIGSPGATSVTGTLSAVNWATGNKFLQVEIDPKGGTLFTDAGTTQLLSVPYAIYAAGAPPTGNAGGSLSGSYPNPFIANGAVFQSMIAAGVTLPPNGPAGGSLTGTYPNPTVANGAIIQSMIAPGVTLPPNGPAGGSLTGTYPNPAVANGAIIQPMIAAGVTLPPSGSAGGSLTGTYPNPVIANGAVTQAMLAPGITLPPTGPAGGDLSGNFPNPTVSKIQGRNISNIAPVINNVLGFDGTNWAPVSLASISQNDWTLSGNNIYNNNSGNVGIGTNTPARKLHVVGDALFADSVVAKAIRSGSNSVNTGLESTGSTFGIRGKSSFTGVRGDGTLTGVYGNGADYGVHGNSVGKGVYGESINGYGVYGISDNTGVYGDGDLFGVHGFSGFAGVYGQGEDFGVYGESEYGDGVFGVSLDIGVNGSGGTIGVKGVSPNGYGVYGVSENSRGVYGYSINNNGGYFHSTNGYGLWARTDRADRNWAGVFEGNVFTYNSYQTSDSNLKKDIKDVGNAMGIIKQLKPKIYEFRNDGKLSYLNLPKGKHYGVLAQDLEEVLPNLVMEVENEVSPPVKMGPISIDNKKEDKKVIEKPVPVEKAERITLKAVNYTELIPIMIKAMQEQQQTIDELKNKNTALEARLTRLESILATGTKK